MQLRVTSGLAAAFIAALGGAACSRASPHCHECYDGEYPSDAAADPGPGDARAADGQGDTAPGDPREPFTCGAATSVTMDRLWPEPGELYYAQLGLSGTVAMGEAAVTVWPDGQVVLVDVGNDSHTSTIVGFVNGVITEMNSRGFPSRAAGAVDHLLLTHYHSDHTDGLENLLGQMTVSGRVVYRGMYDLVGLTNGTVQSMCSSVASLSGAALPLCLGPSEGPCSWTDGSGAYPTTGCSGAQADSVLGFASGTGMRVLGIDGWMNGESYQTVVQAIADGDNGENAKSPVVELMHGSFRMLVSGDLTHDGYGTYDLEAFYVPRIGSVSDIDTLGVDVLKASHHGRRTSTSQAWVDRLLPNDGKSRTVVMGVSQAHYGSPFQEALNAIFSSSRLTSGLAWTTRVASGGVSDGRLIDAAGGHVIVRTYAQGRAYYVQAVSSSGTVIATRRYDAVRACP